MPKSGIPMRVMRNKKAFFGKGRRMKKICSVIATGIIAISICGCGQPIMNLEDYKVPSLDDGSPQSIETVKKAILTACKDKGWSPSVVGDGLIEAEIMVRTRHRALIEIPFSGSHYSIIYKDSHGLGYEKRGKIHRNYNRWVAMLSAAIQRELGVRSQRF